MSFSFVVRAGASRFDAPTPFLGVHPNDLKISSRDTGGALCVYDYRGARDVGPVAHLHLHQDEIFYVAAGSFLFQVGEETLALSKGDTIFLARDVPHAWVQTSEESQLIYLLQPAGEIEAFFDALTRRTGPVSPEEDERLNAHAGIRNTGPALDAVSAPELTDAPAHGFVVRTREGRLGESVELGGEATNRLVVGAADTSGALSVFHYEGRAPGGPPLHVHPHQDEIFHVLAGEYWFQCGDERFSLTAGDAIFLPRGVPHAFTQVGARGELLFYFTPSGKMEGFFHALSALPGPPSPVEGAQVFAAHEMEVVGPPI